MSLFEFDEDYYMELFREEYRQEGKQEGRQEGISQGIRNAFAMLKDVGLSEEDAIMRIAAQYQLPENEIRHILSEVPDRH